MKTVKIILALLLIICCVDMPYGYYMFVRFVAMLVFVVLAFTYYESKKQILGFVFGGLALLFQPFAKIVLGRELWNVVDVIVAILLIVLVVKESK